MNDLKTLSSSVNMTEEELERFYNIIYQRKKKEFPNISDQELQESSLKELESRLRKRRVGLGNVEEFEGILFSKEALRDYTKKIREVAEQKWREDPAKAIAEGYCDQDGTPKDYRVTFKRTGNKNPNYGRRLTGPEYNRVYRGIDTKTGKTFNLSLDGEDALKDIPLMTIIKFKANNKTKPDSPYLSLSAPLGGFNYEVVQELDSEKIKMLMESLIPQERKIKYSDIPFWYQANNSKVGEFFVTEAQVVSISPRPSAKGNLTIELDDFTSDEATPVLRGFVPADMVKFGVSSIVYVVGTAMELDTPDGNKELVLNISGLFPKDAVLPPQSVDKFDPSTSLEGEEGDGW